jgi:hypothetical protein
MLDSNNDNTQDHYFSFSALESLWENTHMMAESLTRAPSSPSSPTPEPASSLRLSKPPRLPPPVGRPPLSPSSPSDRHMAWESVETVMSPRSIDDVRLLVVPSSYDLKHFPVLPLTVRRPVARSSNTSSSIWTGQAMTENGSQDHDHSLDFTPDGSTATASQPRVRELELEYDDDDDDSQSDLDDDLVGLDLLEDMAVEEEEEEEVTERMHLDLAFLKRDPPQAHRFRFSRF